MKSNVKDEVLAAKAQAGDDQAMEELLLRYAGLVRGRARGFFLVGGETEDLIQEGMIGLYRAISDYKSQNTTFKTFAYVCITRRILDAVKASARKKNIPLNGYVSLFDADEAFAPENPETELIRGEDKREFLQKMSRELSDFEFKVTVMYMDGMSCSEICEATDKDAKSVDNAIQRSKKKLQKLLKITAN